MSDALQASELKALHEQLLQLKAELTDLLSGGAEHAQPVALDQQAMGRVSRIDAIQQQQMARAGQGRDKRRLVACVAALGRIDDEDYGYCEQCGGSIGFPRLRVMPEASYCLRCQGLREG